LVHAVLVEGLLIPNREGTAPPVEFLKKAAQISRVTGSPGLLDFKEEHVAITVRKPAADLLFMAAGLALEPELFSRTAPVMHESGLERLFERVAIHPGEHQDATARPGSVRSLLHDRRNETVRREFEIEFHCCRIADCRIIENSVKEREISKAAVSDAVAPQIACHRFRSSPPATISLGLAHIVLQIPEAARLPEFDESRSVELPCEEIFAAPSPKLRLSRLAEVAPEYIRRGTLPDFWIRLPAGPLALGYHFSDKSEPLDESALPESKEPRPDGPFHPAKDPEPETKISSLDSPESRESALPERSAASKNGEKEVNAAAAPLVPSTSTPPEDSSASPPYAEVPPEEERSAPGSSRVPDLPAQAEGPASSVSPDVATPLAASGNGGAPVLPPADLGPPPDFSPGEFAKPAASFEFSSAVRSPGLDASPQGDDGAELSVRESSPSPSAHEAVLVEVEHLRKDGTGFPAEISNQDALQAVFLTEDFLSLERVVELCGGLPGIRSCVLAHGSAVLASYNVPESIDLVSLSAHALELLAAIRQSSSRMGVGAVPAVTIHSEKGPITFFHRDDLCLLVMHRDRGFVPGVREKLQLVVEHLSEANLALPVGASRPALARREMPR